MTKTFLSTLFVFSIIAFSTISKGQTHSYSIMLAGKRIGSIQAVRTVDDNKAYYDVFSDVNFKVLWKKYNRKTKNLLEKENGHLVNSRSGIYMNDVLEDSAYFIKKGEKFYCYRYPDDEFEREFSEITHHTMDLYFKEPVGLEKIYSERFLAYCKVRPKGLNKYVISLPNGKENVYTYEEGVLVEVFVDRNWFNLTFKRDN